MLERENRYVVLSRKAIARSLSEAEQNTLKELLDLLEMRELAHGKPPRSYVVIREDYPEYEPTWEMLKDRVEGGFPPRLPSDYRKEIANLRAIPPLELLGAKSFIRNTFEEVVSSPPYELDPFRYPPDHAVRPGVYRNYDLHLAWDVLEDVLARLNTVPLPVLPPET